MRQALKRWNTENRNRRTTVMLNCPKYHIKWNETSEEFLNQKYTTIPQSTIHHIFFSFFCSEHHRTDLWTVENSVSVQWRAKHIYMRWSSHSQTRNSIQFGWLLPVVVGSSITFIFVETYNGFIIGYTRVYTFMWLPSKC